MKDVDPAEVAAEMLKALLPGFESRINPATDKLVIHGALPIGLTVDSQVVYYPLMRDVYRESPLGGFARALRDVSETDAEREIREAAERARQTEALKRELAYTVADIAERIQRYAIEAVGLEPVIAERERRAAERGRSEGYVEGKRAGRREILAELDAIREEREQAEADAAHEDEFGR